MILVTTIDRPASRKVIVSRSGQRLRDAESFYRRSLGRYSPPISECDAALEWAEAEAARTGEEIKHENIQR